MALQALHEIYWPGDGVEGEAPPSPAQYPAYQAHIVTMNAGVPLPSLNTWKYWWTKVRRLLAPDRARAAFHALRLIYSSDYSRAREVVREVARTPGMNNGDAWGEVGRRMAQRAGTGENVYRMLLAVQKFGDPPNRKRHETNLLLELAYFSHKER